MNLHGIGTAAVLAAGLLAQAVRAVGAADWSFLDNGVLRLGVDRARGVCIGYLAESATGRNLLNHYDAGRFIQQSYYGQPDGSFWNGTPWVYNPVQGGSWDGKPSRMLAFRLDPSSHTVEARIEPRRWSSGLPCPEAVMEARIGLESNLVRVAFAMTYQGEDQGKARHQEMPAMFVDGAFSNLVVWTGDRYQRMNPGILAENGRPGGGGPRYGKAPCHWVAYVDDRDWGIGLLAPGTEEFTCYRALGDGVTGPAGSACAYVAPLRTFALTPGLQIDYTFYLTLGSLDAIRERFEARRTQHGGAVPAAVPAQLESGAP